MRKRGKAVKRSIQIQYIPDDVSRGRQRGRCEGDRPLVQTMGSLTQFQQPTSGLVVCDGIAVPQACYESCSKTMSSREEALRSF